MQSMIRFRARIAPLALIGGLCGGCLDLLGHEEDVIQNSDVQGMMQIEDDRIEDKHPVFDPARTVTEMFDYCPITMNKSAAVTKLDIVPFEGADSALDKKLFRGRTEALAAIAGIDAADPIPSMEVVNGALKPFNDGLYAAVELEIETSKRALFATLATRLAAAAASADAATRPAFDDASELVGTAQILGGYTPTVDPAVTSRAQGAAAAFQAQPAIARPIGFYTWTQALQRIFTRDRFLQNRDGGQTPGALAAIALLLGQDPALLADYQHVTALYAGLTNPYVSYPIDALIPYVPAATALANPKAAESGFSAANPVREPCNYVPVAFLPASRSKEVDYFEKLYCLGVPDGTSFLGVLIDGIKSGAVDLTPAADSGWYDYQIYALETLLLPERGPESQNLLLTAGYKKKLIETFKSILIQTRETHVKQLNVGTAGSAGGPAEPVDAYPLHAAEPFPTFYLRTARAYRFLRTFLPAVLGSGFLSGTDRLVESGGRGTDPLAHELDQRVSLLYGLAFIEADAVGMDRTTGLMADELAEIDPTAAIAAARTWLAGWKIDADVVRDPRVIVPVFHDDTGMTTYWAVIGVKALVSRAEFVAGHEPVVTPSPCWTGKLVPHRYTMLVEETAEVRLPTTTPPPTRDELRAVCDAHATKDAIVQALGSR